MRVEFFRRLPVALLLVVGLGPSAQAAPIPSRAADVATAPSSDAQREAIESLLARDEVARALAAHGLTAAQAEERLARLSAEDVCALATNLDRIQAAGAVPNYIWVLLAILMGVTILATVF